MGFMVLGTTFIPLWKYLRQACKNWYKVGLGPKNSYRYIVQPHTPLTPVDTLRVGLISETPTHESSQLPNSDNLNGMVHLDLSLSRIMMFKGIDIPCRRFVQKALRRPLYWYPRQHQLTPTLRLHSLHLSTSVTIAKRKLYDKWKKYKSETQQLPSWGTKLQGCTESYLFSSIPRKHSDRDAGISFEIFTVTRSQTPV